MGNFLGEVPVEGGLWSTVPLIAGTTLGAQVPDGAEVEIRIELDRPVVAPVRIGAKVGVAVFLIDGAEWGRADALCGEEVPLPATASAAPELAAWELEDPYGALTARDWEASYGQSAASGRQTVSVISAPDESAASVQPTAFNWEAAYDWERLSA